MKDINETRNRIKYRRHDIKTMKQRNRLFSFVYRSILLFMLCGVVMLFYMINEKINFVDIKGMMNKMNFDNVQTWIPFENWFSFTDQKVSSFPSYSLLKGDYYTNGSNEVYALLDGVVLQVEKNVEHNMMVRIKHDNGVIAIYQNMEDSFIKKDERIKKGNVIGTYTDSIMLFFSKDDKTLTLEEALALE